MQAKRESDRGDRLVAPLFCLSKIHVLLPFIVEALIKSVNRILQQRTTLYGTPDISLLTKTNNTYNFRQYSLSQAV